MQRREDKKIQDQSKGGPEITIEEVDIQEYRNIVKKNYLDGSIREPAQHIRLVFHLNIQMWLN